jgi:cyclopropane fatty-acyl-phospholipid synthase-like methyltransferase
MNAYDELPYVCYPVPCTAPEQLAMASFLHDGPCPRVENARVLEIGCGDGANLLPLAYFRPDCEFVGVDASAVQIADARRSAERLGLKNITLHAADICAIGPELGQFDYVVAHGVMSWVADDVRDGILAFCRDHLSDDGLAYLSFNTHPGWLVRGVVRNSIQGPRGPGDAMRERVNEARRRVAAIRPHVEHVKHPYAQILGFELARFEAEVESSVVHDYLSEHNRAYWFREFASLAAGFGFRYVTEAAFTQPDHRVPRAIREAARGLGNDPAMIEEMVDVLWFRQHRTSLFCRDAAPIASRSDSLRFDRIVLATGMRPRSAAAQLAQGVDETFDAVLEPSVAIVVSDALGKAALTILAAIWPLGLRWPQLVAQSRARVRASGFDAPPEAEAHLRAELVALHAIGQVDLRLRDLRSTAVSSELPATVPLTQWEVERRPMITTPTHQRVSLAKIDRLIVAQMNGAQTAAEITAAVVATLRENEAAGAAVERPLSMTAEQWVGSRLEHDRAFLASWGLLR